MGLLQCPKPTGSVLLCQGYNADYIPCLAMSCCRGRRLQLLVGGMRNMTVS
jgi:hypothetical protein